MLIDCPECGRERVSSFARACPACGYPISEDPAGPSRATETAHTLVGEVDCSLCEARGFRTFTGDDGSESFQWCVRCHHSGRVLLGQTSRGFYEVDFAGKTAFEAGNADAANFLGSEAPDGFRYPAAGRRVPPEDS